jgi:hypothetical protein
MKTSRTSVLMLCLLAAGCARSGAPVAAAPALLSADIPAAGVVGLTLMAGAGEVKLTSSADDAVHVQLDLHQDERSFLGVFHWVSDATTRDLTGASLKQQRDGGELTLSLAFPSGSGHSDVKQKWTLSLPARLALNTEMTAGRLEIDGLRGGVTAHLGAGDLTIHSPGGPLTASVGAGRLHVISDDTHPGAVHLRSTFGLAVLDFNGKFYGPPERHDFMSSLHLFGNRVTQQGDGQDAISLRTSAGLVDLRIGAVGDVKDYRGVFTAD